MFDLCVIIVIFSILIIHLFNVRNGTGVWPVNCCVYLLTLGNFLSSINRSYRQWFAVCELSLFSIKWFMIDFQLMRQTASIYSTLFVYQCNPNIRGNIKFNRNHSTDCYYFDLSASQIVSTKKLLYIAASTTTRLLIYAIIVPCFHFHLIDLFLFPFLHSVFLCVCWFSTKWKYRFSCMQSEENEAWQAYIV